MMSRRRSARLRRSSAVDWPPSGRAWRNGEGGIRTLEAGISPPNALAGRRLQPLGHFSGARIVSGSPVRESPPWRAFGEAEGEGFEPSMHLSAHTRFPVALLRPLGHPSGKLWS